jgi:calcineurin-like phosphoesterase family protein
MLWFTADTHFNHHRIIGLCRRPFADVAEMNKALIVNWRTRVQPDDVIYVLGDFAFHYRDAQPLDEIFDQLPGEKHLVVGNHDEQNPKVLRLPWKSQSQIAHVRYGETRFVLCHFPMETWWHRERGVLHLHGHCHGTLERKTAHRFDVGADPQGYMPVSASQVIVSAAPQILDNVDGAYRKHQTMTEAEERKRDGV